MRLISFQSAYQQEANQQMKIGERAITPDGRVWRYVNLTSTTSAGAIVQPDPNPVHQFTMAAGTLSLSANPVGQYVYLTYSTGGLTAGALEEGWVYLYIGTGEGYALKVKTNTSSVIEFYPQYATVFTATTGVDSTTGAKVWCPFNVNPSVVTTQTNVCTGIAQIAFTAGYYGFVLMQGYGTVLGSSLVAGHGFGPGGATAGYGLIATTGKGPYDQFNMGYIIIAANDASNQNFVYVTF